MIPKRIFSVWLSSDGSMPDVIRRCIESQKIPGYEHVLVTLDNMDEEFRNSRYMQEAFKSPHWDGIKYCKMSDYLRMRYLYKYGGIYLDADVSVLPGRSFDHILENGMFAARENNGFIGTATVAAQKGHPFIGMWIDAAETRFRGDDDKNFESSMEILTRGYNEWAYLARDFRLYPTATFFPYDHQRGTVEVNPNTISFHHFTKTWTDAAKDVLPRVSIILPTLGREEGLRKCLKSIDELYYPWHLIETIVLDGEGTVPVKIKKGVEQARGDVIVYAANDMVFEPESLALAVQECQKTKGLVAFGGRAITPDEGNICEHFVIHKDLIPHLENGEVFSTDFHHAGCDNWLWAQAKKLGKATLCQEAIVHHYHFSTGGTQDEVYAKGWSRIAEDRLVLKEKLEALNGL